MIMNVFFKIIDDPLNILQYFVFIYLYLCVGIFMDMRPHSPQTTLPPEYQVKIISGLIIF